MYTYVAGCLNNRMMEHLVTDTVRIWKKIKNEEQIYEVLYKRRKVRVVMQDF